MTIKNIKDMEPNQGTINLLERLLDEAKRGELRTIVYLCGYDDDEWSNGWSVDKRNSRRKMIGELTMLHSDMVVNQSLADGDTVLARQFD